MSLMSRFLGTPWMARSPLLLYRIGLGSLLGSGMMMLEHIGRTSGDPKRVVLEVAERESDSALVIASGFGSRSQWFKNLQHNPNCKVWSGKLRGIPARAEFLDTDESNAVLEKYKVTHAAMWERLRVAIAEITGEEPVFIPMVRLHLQV